MIGLWPPMLIVAPAETEAPPVPWWAWVTRLARMRHPPAAWGPLPTAAETLELVDRVRAVEAQEQRRQWELHHAAT
jgi:hypothetical protein